MAVINIKQCVIVVRGGTFGQYINLKIGNGNVTYDEKKKRDYIMDRGLLDTVRDGDDEPMDVRFDFQWIHITAASGDLVPTFEDALKQRGPASSWDSSSGDACEPYAVDVVIKDSRQCNDTPETIILPDFRYESLNHDLKASSVACSGKCNSVQALPTRGSLQSY